MLKRSIHFIFMQDMRKNAKKRFKHSSHIKLQSSYRGETIVGHFQDYHLKKKVILYCFNFHHFISLSRKKCVLNCIINKCSSAQIIRYTFIFKSCIQWTKKLAKKHLDPWFFKDLKPNSQTWDCCNAYRLNCLV